jgi:hypothetical protein
MKLELEFGVESFLPFQLESDFLQSQGRQSAG